jgi:hypothetical protein
MENAEIVKGQEPQSPSPSIARPYATKNETKPTNDNKNYPLVDKLFSENLPDWTRRKIICFIIEDYVKRYKPNTKQQVIKYVTTRNIVPYYDARDILDALINCGRIRRALL